MSSLSTTRISWPLRRSWALGRGLRRGPGDLGSRDLRYLDMYFPKLGKYMAGYAVLFLPTVSWNTPTISRPLRSLDPRRSWGSGGVSGGVPDPLDLWGGRESGPFRDPEKRPGFGLFIFSLFFPFLKKGKILGGKNTKKEPRFFLGRGVFLLWWGPPGPYLGGVFRPSEPLSEGIWEVLILYGQKKSTRNILMPIHREYKMYNILYTQHVTLRITY